MRNKYNYLIDITTFILLVICCFSMVYTYLSFKEKGESQQLLLLVDKSGSVYSKKNLLEPFSYKKVESQEGQKIFSTEALQIEAAYTSQLATEYLDKLLNFDYISFDIKEPKDTLHMRKIREFFYDDNAFEEYKKVMSNTKFSKHQKENKIFVAASILSPLEFITDGIYKANTTTRTIQLAGTYYVQAFSTTDSFFNKRFKVKVSLFLTRVNDMKDGQHYKIIQTTMEGFSDEVN